MKTKLFFLLTSFIVLFFSCVKKKDDLNKKVEYQVELDDSLEKVITEYVVEHKIDISSRVIVTEWSTGMLKTDVFISNSSESFHDNLPTFYSLLNDSIVVFVYTGFEENILRNTNKIKNEISDIVKEKRIELNSANNHFMHEPRWLYSFCDTNANLIKDTSPFELLEVPCGYVLLSDTLGTDSTYMITKRK